MPYMTLLAEGAADTSVLSQEVITALQTGFQSVVTAVLAITAVAVGAGITVMAVKMAIKKGIGIFKAATN